MKQLTLIFLFVFVGQLAAVSDVEMLPRVMGALKKDLDSSKTWEDFFSKTDAVSYSDIVAFNQIVGLKTKLPKYEISENLRTLKTGGHVIEIVNLKTADFKIDGKPYRMTEGESIYETMYKLKHQKTISFFNSLFSSEAMAADVKSICEKGSAILNQVFNHGGLKEEMKSSALHLVSVAGAALYYNCQMGADSKQERAERCEDMVKALQDNQGQARLVEVNCAGALASKHLLKFAVSGSKVLEEAKTNKFGVSDSYRKEEYKSKGEFLGAKILEVNVNWNARELATAGFERAYLYDEHGMIVESATPGKVDGKNQLVCTKGSAANFERNIQIHQVIPSLQTFSRKGICHSSCVEQVKAFAAKNKAELEELAASGLRNHLGNADALEGSAKCDGYWNKVETEVCYRELIGYRKGPRPACSQPKRHIRIPKCDDKTFKELRNPRPVEVKRGGATG